MMGAHALLDGDILVYRCGFAAEKSRYTLTNINTGKAHDFQYKKEVDLFVKDNGLDMNDYNLEKIKTVEPLGFALQNVRTVIEAILERLGAADYTLYLTGGKNFRDDIAKTRIYKGNRDPEHRPVYYKEIREYMIDTWQALVTDGIEADDIIADICNHPVALPPLDEFVIVSTDKDLDQIPGDHYNWVKDELYHVDAFQASRNMWMRVLSGDPTDNIQGIPGMGPKKAEKYLDSFEPPEWERAVLHAFEDSYGMDEGGLVLAEHVRLVKLGAPAEVTKDGTIAE